MNNKRSQAMAVLAVAALAVFAWDLGRRQAINSLSGSGDSSASEGLENALSPANSDEADAVDTAGAGNAFLLTDDGESVKVKDQPAGMEVRVSSLSLSETGWVGVRDDEGRVLGAGRFDAGDFTDVAIPLLRATVSGGSYQVLLYVDDGDRIFDLRKDILITGPNGGVAGTNFKAL